MVDGFRLAYISDEMVNWSPGLGTVLANEEVTADGRSDVGNYPVYRRPLRQWMLRITAYADRLLADLEPLDWPEPIKRCSATGSAAATARMIEPGRPADRRAVITVFTTRPDTLPGATYWCWRPSIRWRAASPPLPGRTAPRPLARRRRRAPAAAVHAYRERAAAMSDRQRTRQPGQDRRVHRRLRHQPGHRRADPGVHRRLRADGLRHRRDHGGARARPARLRRSQRVRAADPGGASRGAAGERGWARPSILASRAGQLGQPAVSTRRAGVVEAKAAIRRWLEDGHGERRGPTGCGTGCFPGSGTGASRSRSSTTRSACRARSRRTAAGHAAGDDRVPAAGAGRTAATASRCRRWPGRETGRRWSWTWATAAGPTGAS